MDALNDTRNKDIALVNGLRGIAIIGVIFHHSFGGLFSYGTGPVGAPAWVSLIASSGWLGVNLFFFLSGFVLMLPYATGERSMTTPDGKKQFYLRRLRRLGPLYLFICLVSVVFVAGLQLNQSMVGAAFLYSTVYFPWNPVSFFPPGNWVLWSLGVEIWFSVLFPLLVCWLGKLGWRVFLPMVAAAAFGARFLGYWFNPPMPGVILNFVSDSVIGRLDDFAMGMLAAHLFAQRRIRFQSAWWLLVSGVLVSLAATLWWYWTNKQIPQTTVSLCGPLLNVGIFLGFLHLLAAAGRVSAWLSAMLSARWLQLMGIMCYSIYCWHGIILLKLKPSYMNGATEYLTYLGITLVLSWFTFRFIEFGHIKSWQDLIPGGLPNVRWYRMPGTARVTK